MFSSENVFVMTLGIILALSFITGAVYYVNKIFVSNTKDILVRFVLVVFTALVALFIVDKTIAFKVKLLNEETDAGLFDLIKTLTLMIFSYYFGTKNSKSED